MSDTNDVDVYAAPLADRVPRSVYIHVPFCMHRCGYCDFTLVADKDELIPSYLQALSNELQRLDRRYEVDTIFVGGGTPTHLSTTDLAALFELINRHFSVAAGGEVSIEANPDGLGVDCLQVLQECGVNRMSLGVQSFDQDVLKTLERTHSPAEAQEVVGLAASVIPNVSIDLIFGVPGQSLDTWQATLKAACDLPVKHISTYGLTFEKGTDFFRRLKGGSLQSCADAEERDMYAMAMTRLDGAGLRHYEISNFARSGSECRHNVTYWQAKDYFAFGPGAARYVNGIRSTNARHVGRWISRWKDNQVALQDWEQLAADAVVREAVFLGLRRVVGISSTAFEQQFGVRPEAVDPEAFESNVAKGWLEHQDGHLRLTSEGRYFADSVVSDFL